MKSITHIFVLLLTAVVGGTALAGGTNSVLLHVAAQLQSDMTGLDPAPACEYPDPDVNGGGLLIQYQTDKFPVTVPAAALAGGAATKVVYELGPKTNGFLLQIQLERLGEGNPVPTPSTQRDTAGETFFNCTPVGGTTNQIFWSLSYGDQVDKDLVERLKKNLWQQGFSVRHKATPQMILEPGTPTAPSAPTAPVNLQVK